MIFSLTAFLACLSVEWLNTSYEVAYVMAAVSTAVVLASLFVEARRKKFSWLAIYAPLLILHPAWRLALGEIRHGSRQVSADCGFGNRGESIFLTVTLVALFIILSRGRLGKRLFLLRVVTGCWFFHVLVFFLRQSSPLRSLLSAEVLGTIEGGEGAVGVYTVILTLICAVLYLLRYVRLRRRRSDATAISQGSE
jgi:hypothetical protein